MSFIVTYTLWELENGNDWVDSNNYRVFSTKEITESFVQSLLEDRNVVDIAVKENVDSLKDFWDYYDRIENGKAGNF